MSRSWSKKHWSFLHKQARPHSRLARDTPNALKHAREAFPEVLADLYPSVAEKYVRRTTIDFAVQPLAGTTWDFARDKVLKSRVFMRKIGFGKLKSGKNSSSMGSVVDSVA